MIREMAAGEVSAFDGGGGDHGATACCGIFHVAADGGRKAGVDGGGAATGVHFDRAGGPWSLCTAAGRHVVHRSRALQSVSAQLEVEWLGASAR